MYLPEVKPFPYVYTSFTLAVFLKFPPPMHVVTSCSPHALDDEQELSHTPNEKDKNISLAQFAWFVAINEAAAVIPWSDIITVFEAREPSLFFFQAPVAFCGGIVVTDNREARQSDWLGGVQPSACWCVEASLQMQGWLWARQQGSLEQTQA